jgi:hypothetical protein
VPVHKLGSRRTPAARVEQRNPESPRPPNAGRGIGRQARFPPILQERFAGRRFIPVDPVEFLDCEGAELILIGAEENQEEEPGIEFKPDDEASTPPMCRGI